MYLQSEYTVCILDKISTCSNKRVESLGNDDVSSLNARKCVASNDDVKTENAQRSYGYCDVTITGGFMRVLCFLKDFCSFSSDEVACPGLVAVKL